MRWCLKRLKWYDAELNRRAAQHSLEIIEHLRPSDFIKVLAVFGEEDSGELLAAVMCSLYFFVFFESDDLNAIVCFFGEFVCVSIAYVTCWLLHDLLHAKLQVFSPLAYVNLEFGFPC